MPEHMPHDSGDDLEKLVEQAVDRIFSTKAANHIDAFTLARRDARIEAILRNRAFNIVYPAGNSTCMLEPRACPPEQLPAIAQQMMSEGLVEQVGVMEKSDSCDAHVQMANGEFCLNGIRTAAALIHKRAPKTSHLHILCSGNDTPVECRCEDIDIKRGIVRIEAVIAEISPHITKLEDGISIVHMDGISHFLIPVENEREMRGKSGSDLHGLMEKYATHIGNVPAVGAIYFTHDSRGLSIKPIVHSVMTVEETACASGSDALGIYQHYEDEKNQNMQILQPSGERYSVTATTVLQKGNKKKPSGVLMDVHIASTVQIQRDCTDLQ